MSDRIRFAVSAKPIETLTDENSGTHDVIASEVGTTLSGGGDSISLTDYSGSAVQQGFTNATVNYISAPHSAGGAVVSTRNTTCGDFFFIKNTGYKYSSATALGASTTDCVLVVASIGQHRSGDNGGWMTSADADQIHFVELGWLKPGQAIALPAAVENLSITQFGSNAGDLTSLNRTPAGAGESTTIYVRTFQSDGSAASSGNAVQFLVVT